MMVLRLAAAWIESLNIAFLHQIDDEVKLLQFFIS